MSDVSGIPNLGIPGMGGGPQFANPFGYVNNAVAQNQANMLANYNANLAYVGAQNQASLNNAYGPQGFGGQTAYYAGLGAAYGRNTGYYGDTSGLPPGQAPLPGGGGAVPSGDVWRGQDLPDISKPWVNPVGTWEAGYGYRNPDVLAAAQASGGDINAFLENHLAQFGMNEGRQVFDSFKYYQDNPDVFNAGADAWTHYNNFGRNEGRQAEWGSAFNPNTYLADNPDVAAAGVNPLQHWLQFGIQEGRQGGGLVEGTPYNDFGLPAGAFSATGDIGQSRMGPGFGGFNNPGTPQNPISQYTNGGFDPYNPDTYAPTPTLGKNFNMQGYYDANPDALREFKSGGWGISDPTKFAEAHLQAAYNAEGGLRGGWEQPNSDFDTAGYFANNPDALKWFTSGTSGYDDPTAFAEHHLQLAHQAEGGMRGGWANNPDFDVEGYFKANPDAADWFGTGTTGYDDPTKFAEYHLGAAHDAEGGGYRGGWLTNSDPGFDTAGYYGAHPEAIKAFFAEDNPYTNPTAYAEMSNYQSPSNDYSTFQKGPTYNWQSSIPAERFDPNTINAIYQVAGQYGFSPAALAAVIQMETGNNANSLWNPQIATEPLYRGLTQMFEQTFREQPGGKLNGLTYDQYQKASAAQQIDTYGKWLDYYAKTPNSAANLVKGGIGSLPVEMQAAIMQATQFAPNATSWVQALGQGDMSGRTTPSPQAPALKDTSIGQMNDVFADLIGKWR